MAIHTEGLSALVKALVEKYDASTTPDNKLIGQGLIENDKGLAAFYIRYLGNISSEETLALLLAWSEQFSWVTEVTVDDLPTIQSAMQKAYLDRLTETQALYT